MKFSKIEKEHLLKAWAAISLAFAILLGDIFSPLILVYLVISLFTVGIGFVIHELAHKYFAQRYGCIAEFRADDKMLIFAVVSAFLGFIFAAPGAVLIHGNLTPKKRGIISMSGPTANFIISMIFFAASFFSGQGIIGTAMMYGFRINAFLALFNMIPFFGFDGEKVWRWSKPVHIISTMIFFFAAFLLPAF